MIAWTLTLPCGCVADHGDAPTVAEAEDAADAARELFAQLVARGEINEHNDACTAKGDAWNR